MCYTAIIKATNKEIKQCTMCIWRVNVTFFFKDIHYFNIIVHATHLGEVTGLILDELFTHKNCVMTNLTLNCSYLALVIKEAICTTNKNILIVFFVISPSLDL